MLSKKLIQEYKRIISEEYGVNLDDYEASEQAHSLVRYFDLLAKIDHESKRKDKEKIGMRGLSKTNKASNINKKRGAETPRSV